MTQSTSTTPKMHQGATRDMLIWAVVILFLIGGGWWWLQNMEKSWMPEIRPMEQYRKQPMLAASRLLEQRGFQINEVDALSLEAIDRAPNGTLIISNNDGTMSREQAQRLLNWVSRGNTLITFPQMRDVLPKLKKPETSEAGKEEQKEDEKENDDAAEAEKRRITPYLQPQTRRYNASMQDPISEYLGLATNFSNSTRGNTIPQVKTESNPASSADSVATNNDEVDEDYDEEESAEAAQLSALAQNQNLVTYVPSNESFVQLPHVNRPVQITRSSMGLYSFQAGPKAIYQDEDASQLRLYQHGKGKIIAMPQNIFVGHSLKWNDNAQFLLDCATLNDKAKVFTIVKGLRLATWRELLWQNFYYSLLVLAALILLWSWRGIRRFGLLLPEMELERRALSEHIDASARWAWTTAEGRQQLIEAARKACYETLRRRAPELLRLSEQEMLQAIANHTAMNLADLSQAWQGNAASTPIQFTRQIQLLQQLRAHYER